MSERVLLPMWVVYRSPRDYPGSWVARLWHVTRSKLESDWWTRTVLVAPTHEQLVAALPPGLYRMPRAPDDDPAIVEVWL
jgi:hypothetical protein